MLSDDDIARDAGQLAAYRGADTLSEILDKYASLMDEYRRLKSDYEEERDAREKYKQQAKSQERNPFVLVLVDGDGYVFNEDLISGGPDAGSNAAQVLHDAVRASLRKKGLEHCQVMVRIYANVAGLSKALCKADGSVGAEKRSLAPFIASFNRSYGLTELVDAGELKENADFKLRALLNLYAENAQCKHIYFAACHDVGYISDLTAHRGNATRFTLIDAPCIRFQKEFTKLAMGIETLPGVFRNSPLDLAAAHPPHNPMAAAEAPRVNGTPTVPPPAPKPSPATPKPLTISTTATLRAKVACQNYPSGKCKFGSKCRFLHVDDPSNSAAPGSATPNWRIPSAPPVRDGKKESLNAALADIKKLPKKGSVPDGYIPVNLSGHRLDPYVPPAADDVVNRLNARTRRSRVCNNFHLNGHCPAGDQCPYDHAALEEGLKEALEALARTTPCFRRGACRNADCTKGHVCQTPDCKTRGGQVYCKIPFLAHSVDMAVAQYVPAVSSPAHASPSTDKTSAEGSSVFGEEDDD